MTIRGKGLNDFLLCAFCALLWLYKFLEAEMVAVGEDGDGATLAGGEDGGAVCVPALDHLLVWMTEH